MEQQIEATLVISALREQLSEAHYKMALLTAHLDRAKEQMQELTEKLAEEAEQPAEAPQTEDQNS